MQLDELINIYHLTESHVPGLRHKAIYRYEKNVQTESDNRYVSINKANIDFNCKDLSTQENVTQMLKKIQEMPEGITSK